MILFRNDTIYCYRYSRSKLRSSSYEYGQCSGAFPENLKEQFKYIAPTYFDTIYPHQLNGGIYDDYHYALADLKTNKYCLFIPRNVKDSSFQIIQQLLNYTDTVDIRKMNNTDEITHIKQKIQEMVERHAIKMTSSFK